MHQSSKSEDAEKGGKQARKITPDEPSAIPGKWGKVKFQDLWLTKDIYKDWLVKYLWDVPLVLIINIFSVVTVINLDPCLKLGP